MIYPCLWPLYAPGGVRNDLNQTIYKLRFKSLYVTCDFDLSQFLNDLDFSINIKNRK